MLVVVEDGVVVVFYEEKEGWWEWEYGIDNFRLMRFKWHLLVGEECCNLLWYK